MCQFYAKEIHFIGLLGAFRDDQYWKIFFHGGRHSLGILGPSNFNIVPQPLTTISRLLYFSCYYFHYYLYHYLVFFQWYCFCIWCRVCYRIYIIINNARNIIIRRRIIRSISVIIKQTTCCFSIVFTVFNQIDIDIATSKSSSLSVNTLLIFDMQLINGALFLSDDNLFFYKTIISSFNGNSSFDNNICITVIT